MNTKFNVQPRPETHYYEPVASRIEKKENQILKYFPWLKVKKKELPWAIGAIGMIGYFTYTDPIFMATLTVVSAIIASCYYCTLAIPYINKVARTKISIWHITSVIFGLTLVLNAATPSHALFLDNLQTAMTNLLTDGGGGTVSEDQVKFVFTIIRIALILLFIGGGIAAYAQFQQGGNWQPLISTPVAFFVVVIAIDVMTGIIVDDNGAGASIPVPPVATILGHLI